MRYKTCQIGLIVLLWFIQPVQAEFTPEQILTAKELAGQASTLGKSVSKHFDGEKLKSLIGSADVKGVMDGSVTLTDLRTSYEKDLICGTPTGALDCHPETKHKEKVCKYKIDTTNSNCVRTLKTDTLKCINPTCMKSFSGDNVEIIKSDDAITVDVEWFGGAAADKEKQRFFHIKVNSSIAGENWVKYRFYIDDVDNYEFLANMGPPLFYGTVSTRFDDCGAVWFYNEAMGDTPGTIFISKEAQTWDASRKLYTSFCNLTYGYVNNESTDVKSLLVNGWNEIGFYFWNTRGGGGITKGSFMIKRNKCDCASLSGEYWSTCAGLPAGDCASYDSICTSGAKTLTVPISGVGDVDFSAPCWEETQTHECIAPTEPIQSSCDTASLTGWSGSGVNILKYLADNPALEPVIWQEVFETDVDVMTCTDVFGDAIAGQPIQFPEIYVEPFDCQKEGDEVVQVVLDFCRDQQRKDILCYERGTRTKIVANWQSSVVTKEEGLETAAVDFNLVYDEGKGKNRLKATAKDTDKLDGYTLKDDGDAIAGMMAPISNLGDVKAIEAKPGFVEKMTDRTQRDCHVVQSQEWASSPQVFTCNKSHFVAGTDGKPPCEDQIICLEWEETITTWEESCPIAYDVFNVNCTETYAQSERKCMVFAGDMYINEKYVTSGGSFGVNLFSTSPDTLAAAKATYGSLGYTCNKINSTAALCWIRVPGAVYLDRPNGLTTAISPALPHSELVTNAIWLDGLFGVKQYTDPLGNVISVWPPGCEPGEWMLNPNWSVSAPAENIKGFVTHPDYPEMQWRETLVNKISHYKCTPPPTTICNGEMTGGCLVGEKVCNNSDCSDYTEKLVCPDDSTVSCSKD